MKMIMENFETALPARSRRTEQEKKPVSEEIEKLQETWTTLKVAWESEGFEGNPLQEPNPEMARMEGALSKYVIELLNSDTGDAEQLYEEARRLKVLHDKEKVYQRAAVHVTNVCRANCLCCPMRRDNLKKETIRRATVDEIVGAAEKSYEAGYRDIFIQGGEDVQIVPVVAEAIRRIAQKYSDVEFTLNLGSLSEQQFKSLYDAGARKYVIKYETATPKLHETLRQDTLQNRVQSMLRAKGVGFQIGSGNILGIPEQTDQDLANDIIFLGRAGIKDMISSTPYTSSEVLPEPYRSQPAADWEKMKRFVAVLRLLFPDAHIHAPSNADSDKIDRRDTSVSGQTELLKAGADEISVEFTPSRVAEFYGLYDEASKRNVITITKAKIVKQESEDKTS